MNPLRPDPAILRRRHPGAFVHPLRKHRYAVAAATVLFAVLVAGYAALGVPPARFISGIGKLGNFVAHMFPPSTGTWTKFLIYLHALAETVAIALLGTFAAALLAFPAGLLAARNIVPQAAIHFLSRRFLDSVRGVDELIWALVWINVVGLGPFAGALAMAMLPLPWSTLPGIGVYNAKIVAAIAAAPWGETTAATNYGTWATSIALAVLVIGLIVRARRGTLKITETSEDRRPIATLPFIAMLIVVTILFLVPWGLGYLFAGTVLPEIRGWNRLIGVLLLLFILGAAATLHRTRAAQRLAVATPIAVVVLALVLADSVIPFRGIYEGSSAASGTQTEAARAYEIGRAHV